MQQSPCGETDQQPVKKFPVSYGRFINALTTIDYNNYNIYKNNDDNNTPQYLHLSTIQISPYWQQYRIFRTAQLQYNPTSCITYYHSQNIIYDYSTPIAVFLKLSTDNSSTPDIITTHRYILAATTRGIQHTGDVDGTCA